jgi:hypothetical protein
VVPIQDPPLGSFSYLLGLMQAHYRLLVDTLGVECPNIEFERRRLFTILQIIIPPVTIYHKTTPAHEAILTAVGYEQVQPRFYLPRDRIDQVLYALIPDPPYVSLGRPINDYQPHYRSYHNPLFFPTPDELPYRERPAPEDPMMKLPFATAVDMPAPRRYWWDRFCVHLLPPPRSHLPTTTDPTPQSAPVAPNVDHYREFIASTLTSHTTPVNPNSFTRELTESQAAVPPDPPSALPPVQSEPMLIDPTTVELPPTPTPLPPLPDQQQLPPPVLTPEPPPLPEQSPT